MDLLEPRVAAARLGVSERRVRALAEQGRLRAEKVAGRWLLDPEGVERRVRAGDACGGRKASARNAWAALFLASGEEPSWLRPSDAARVRRRFLSRPLAKQICRLESRARVGYFVGSAAAQDEVRRHPKFVASGISAAAEYGADVVAAGVVEGYLPAQEADRLAHLFALREVAEMGANLILHAVDIWPFDGRSVAPRAVVAADLARSISERTRKAGEQLLRS